MRERERHRERETETDRQTVKARESGIEALHAQPHIPEGGGSGCSGGGFDEAFHPVRRLGRDDAGAAAGRPPAPTPRQLHPDAAHRNGDGRRQEEDDQTGRRQRRQGRSRRGTTQRRHRITTTTTTITTTTTTMTMTTWWDGRTCSGSDGYPPVFYGHRPLRIRSQKRGYTPVFTPRDNGISTTITATMSASQTKENHHLYGCTSILSFKGMILSTVLP